MTGIAIDGSEQELDRVTALAFGTRPTGESRETYSIYSRWGWPSWPVYRRATFKGGTSGGVGGFGLRLSIGD